MIERLLFDRSELAPLFRVVSFAISSFSAGRALRCQYLLYARLPRAYPSPSEVCPSLPKRL